MVRIGLTSLASKRERFDPQLNYIGNFQKDLSPARGNGSGKVPKFPRAVYFPRLRIAATTAYASHADIIISISILVCAEIPASFLDNELEAEPLLNPIQFSLCNSRGSMESHEPLTISIE